MPERDVTFIVARADNGVIGRDGKLPWHLPEDLKRFKRLTMGEDGAGLPMIMGRKTFDSLPGLLPGRRHIVLTRQAEWQAEGALVAHDAAEALYFAGGDCAVIGGAEIFALMAPYATRYELTHVHDSPPGDTVMPSPADDPAWEEVARDHRPSMDDRPAFDFVSYRRRR